MEEQQQNTTITTAPSSGEQEQNHCSDAVEAVFKIPALLERILGHIKEHDLGRCAIT